MFEALRKSVDAPQAVAMDASVEDVVVQLIDELPDRDPSIVAYRELCNDRAQLQALAAAMKQSKDPQGLAQFANANKTLGTLVPAVAAVETLGAAYPKTCATAIEAFIADEVTPAIEAFWGKGFWSKFFSISVILNLLAAIAVLFLPGGVVLSAALILSAAIAGNLAHATDRNRLKEFQDQQEGVALRSEDLVATAQGVTAAYNAVTALAGMTPPTSAKEAQKFTSDVIKTAQKLKAIGVAVDQDGEVDVLDLPPEAFGKAAQLGYNENTPKVLLAELKKIEAGAKTKLNTIKSGLKTMDAAAARFFESDASEEDKRAVKAAMIVYKDVLSTSLRRLPKAIKFVAGSIKKAVKTFYILPKNK